MATRLHAYHSQDPALGGLSDPDQQQAVFSATCSSGYCNQDGECGTPVALGGDCSADPAYACAEGLSCLPDGNDGQTCQVTPTAAARLRHRRSNLCPSPFSSCSLEGSVRGFECVDTTSNIEQCGACASEGGVDCTALPGVESVGCVAGSCEVRSPSLV